MDSKLKQFFNEWKNDEESRYLSWEYCYLFFKNNHEEILKDEKMLDLATLHLSFYLASWGMYRGSSNLLNKNYTIHTELVKTLLEACKYLFNEDLTWEQIEKANEIIKDYYKEHEVSPTDTLITKVLMGIFACVPAYDRFFIKGLSEYNKNHEHISPIYNKQSYEALLEFAKKLKTKKYLKDTNILYPPMKLVDSCFWSWGHDIEDKKAGIDEKNNFNVSFS